MSEETGPETVECTNCGASIRKHADVCHKCGVENEKKPGRERSIDVQGDPVDDGSIESAFRYPFRGRDGVQRVFIGGLMSYAFFLVVPIFVLFGYLLRVLERSAQGVGNPPDFDDFGDMIVDGLKMTVVSIAYAIAPLLLIIVSVLLMGSGQNGGTAGGIVSGMGAIGLLVSLLAAVVLYYVLPAALTNMAVEDDVGAAFDLDTIKRVVLSGDYLVAWLIPFALGILVNILVGVLWITVIGLVVVPFIQFYVQVVTFRLFGAAFGEVIDVEKPETTTDEADAAAV